MVATTQTITYKFQGNAAGFMRTVTQVSNGLKRVTKTNQDGLYSISETTVGAGRLGNALKSMAVGAKAGVNAFMNMSNSLRLTAQGMMSVGKGLTMFITPLIFLSLKSAAKVAIDFDAALIRVSKTTQLTGKSLDQLAMGLREIGVTTATSQVDLAKMAEQIGQLGVRDVPAILSLVDTFNMLTLATEISADKVAIAMGKIANAFGMDLNTEEGAKEILQLSTVINRLENELAAAAPEILKGLENFAQVGSLIDFPPETGAAFIAALVSVGFSAEESGTALRNMTIKVVQHADEVSQLMANTEGYSDAAAVMTAINEDAAKVLIDLTSAAAAGDDQAKVLFATIEAGGIRGGKAWAAMAGANEVLIKALGVTADEVLSGLSLWNEYQAALLSTENQMKVLRNNFNEVSLTMGDALLPVLNELIQTIIPAIRWIADEFKKLSPEIKKNILVVALLVGVAGPIILFLSQIVFGLSMIMIAVSKVGALILSLGPIFSGLKAGLIGLASAFGITVSGMGLLVTALVTGAAAILLRVTGLGAKIAEVFISLGESAAAWGQNLIATYGAGMLSGAVSVLARVLTAIGNFIGRFLAGSSPPDVGPLSHIDLWGKNVFDAFLGGFMNADFSVLSQVGGMIEKIFSTLAKTKLMGEKDQFKFAMKARQDLAKLITMFNETGEVSQSVLDDITANLGEASDELQVLIRHWLEYTRIQKELAEIEARRSDVLDTYRQEIQLIAQSNRTAEEKADAIRDAMRGRDDSLRILSQEERELEKQKTLAEEQLELQKSMISAMQHQDDLQLKLIDTLKALSSELGDLADFAFPEFETGGIDESLSQTYEAIVTLEERISRMSGVWDSFLAGFRGEDPIDIDDWLLEQLGEEDYAWAKKLGLEDVAPELIPIIERMEAAYETGERIGGTWESIQGTFENVSGFLENLFGDKPEIKGDGKGLLETLGFDENSFAPLKQWMMSLGEKLAPIWADIGAKWAEVWETITDSELGQDIGALFQTIKEKWQEFTDFLGEVDWGELLSAMGDGFLWVVGLVIGVIAWLITGFAWLFTNFVSIMVGLPEKWAEIWDKITTKAGEIKDALILWALGVGTDILTGWANMVTGIQEKWDAFKVWLDEKANKIKDDLILWVLGLATKVVTGFEDIKTNLATIWTNIITDILLKTAQIATDIATAVTNWKTAITDKISEFVTAGGDIVGGIADGITSKAQDAIDAVEGIYNAVLSWWKKIWELESPSKVMFESGQFIMQGAVEGIESMSDDFKATLGLSTEGLIGEEAVNLGGIPSSINTASGLGGAQITLQFGKDSVRSDQDIDDIADAVERVLAGRAEGNMSVGTAF